MVSFARYHLRSRIARTATCRLECLALLVGVAESEVNDLDVIVIIHQQVLWFQVPVANPEFMQVLNARDNLVQESSGFLLS